MSEESVSRATRLEADGALVAHSHVAAFHVFVNTDQGNHILTSQQENSKSIKLKRVSHEIFHARGGTVDCCGSGMIFSNSDPTFQLVSGPDSYADPVIVFPSCECLKLHITSYNEF